MTDRTIITEAIRLVADGVAVTLPVRGRSMLPFIVGDRESVVLVRPDALRRGHVVLACTDDDRYVVHRVIRISADGVTLMGDGNLRGTEHCPLSGVQALATHVVDARGRRRSLYTRRRRLAWRLWWWLRPARRYLLAIYRRL